MFDKNTIDFKEFLQALATFSGRNPSSNPPKREEDQVSFLFRVYDTDADGLIGKEELYTVLKSLVQKSLTEDQLQQIVDKTISDLDGDQDGKINLDEFQSIFSQL
mmetsp:Transcript_24180/g.23762  ORF Transcript_24180/g.23762 Transcript_24180/m.23762 type:complete len:105 (+) Transcript_24180:255-569(+)